MTCSKLPPPAVSNMGARDPIDQRRSEEHTPELQSRVDLVCRLLLEKKNVEVQDRQHRTVPARVEEADALPGALQGSRLRLAVANHGCHEQIRVVEGRAEGMGEHIAELPALVDRARGGDAHMARHAAGRGELTEESTHAV